MASIRRVGLGHPRGPDWERLKVAGYKRFSWLGIGRAQDLRRELEQEIETHVALRTDDLVAQGMSPDAACEEALRRFGDLKAARRELYASTRRREDRLKLRMLADDLARDLRLALRQVGRAPGFSAVAIAIYAVAIGLTTSMFIVVDHVLLRPLPFPEPEQLRRIGVGHGERGRVLPRLHGELGGLAHAQHHARDQRRISVRSHDSRHR